MFMIVALLMGAISYLAVQVSTLNDNYHIAIKTQSLQTVDQDVIDQNIAELRSQIKTQRQVIVDLSSKYSQLTTQIEKSNQVDYMQAPQFELDYALTNNTDSEVTVSEFRLDYYKEQNKFFWDYIVKESLPLVYDRQNRAVKITDLVQNSLFAQMGFEEGDYILNVDGKRILSGSTLRDTLLSNKTKTVAIKRDGKVQSFKIKYQDKFADDVAISLKGGFDSDVKRYISELGVAPAKLDSGIEGIAFSSVTKVPSLADLKLKASDVITKLNGRTVTEQSWSTLFKPVSNRLEVEYYRDGEEKSLFVWVK